MSKSVSSAIAAVLLLASFLSLWALVEDFPADLDHATAIFGVFAVVAVFWRTARQKTGLRWVFGAALCGAFALFIWVLLMVSLDQQRRCSAQMEPITCLATPASRLPFGNPRRPSPLPRIFI